MMKEITDITRDKVISFYQWLSWTPKSLEDIKLIAWHQLLIDHSIAVYTYSFIDNAYVWTMPLDEPNDDKGFIEGCEYGGPDAAWSALCDSLNGLAQTMLDGENGRRELVGKEGDGSDQSN